MSKTEAWLLYTDSTTRVAVGRHELLHLVQSPESLAVPQSPDYCKRVIFWHGKIIPIMDLNAFIGKTSANDIMGLVAIAVYRDYITGEYDFGGIKLEKTPTLVEVDNTQGLARSDLDSKWSKTAVAAISIDGNKVPVLDLSTFFVPHRNNIRV